MSFNRFLEKTITKSQRCQRNWDLSKNIPIDDIKVMKTAVTDCSSKQNRVFYRCKFITNRDVIQQLYEVSDGHTYRDKVTREWKVDKNPQLLANLVVAFIRDRDPSENSRTVEEREHGKYWSEKDEHADITRDQNIALGIASGYLTLTANMMGYSTGCCQCGDMNKMKEILGEDEDILLTMGIGYAGQDKSRLEHHVTGRRMISFNKTILVDDVV